MASEESHRIKAREAINEARKAHFRRPKASLTSTPSNLSIENNVYETARENSIEVYDDKFGRNSILTRSARMRKFKFYQYKRIQDTTPRSTSGRNNNVTNNPVNNYEIGSNSVQSTANSSNSPQSPILLPREDVLQGKVALAAEQSKELSELDDQIIELEKKIADLNGKNGNDINRRNNCTNNLDEIFDLVNKKNDLLRRQMQLNILEQEKVLEKANEELTKELRSLMSIEDSKKTKADLERQQYLYDQSLALVNKRNELVLHMDVQEKGIEDDNELKARLKTVISDTSNRNRLNGHDQNCCIQ